MGHWWSDASLLGCALAYAEQAIPVLPLHHPAVSGSRRRQRWSTTGCSCGQPGCAQPSEHPLTVGGLADASTDSAQVRAWWQRHPEANIGLATGVTFDVLDLDAASGRTALRRLEALAAPTGPVARTGYALRCASKNDTIRRRASVADGSW